MNKPRLPFAPLTTEVDDVELEQLARAKGVGTYDRPAPVAALPVALPIASAPATADAPEEGAAGEQATPRSQMKKVNLELPDYVWTELKIRAARRQVSLRHVVMSSLVADGITIAAVDMVEDGRRLR